MIGKWLSAQQRNASLCGLWHHVLVLALILTLCGPAVAQQQSRPGSFEPDEVQGIEQIVRDYLLNHPEVLVEALTTYQRRQQQAEQEQREQSLIAHRAALTEDPDSPVLGNPEGDVTIVEFFDYRCPYCRRVANSLRKVVDQDGNVRLIMKEFPILGPQSIQAARAALAAKMQGEYEALHWALMSEPGDMSDPHIRRVARTLGLDIERLQQDMQSEEIDQMLQRNHDLARALSITGTPTFVIGDTLVPGAIDAPTLRRLIETVRNRQS